jgi:hypothetical protein
MTRIILLSVLETRDVKTKGLPENGYRYRQEELITEDAEDAEDTEEEGEWGRMGRSRFANSPHLPLSPSPILLPLFPLRPLWFKFFRLNPLLGIPVLSQPQENNDD